MEENSEKEKAAIKSEAENEFSEAERHVEVIRDKDLQIL